MKRITAFVLAGVMVLGLSLDTAVRAEESGMAAQIGATEGIGLQPELLETSHWDETKEPSANAVADNETSGSEGLNELPLPQGEEENPQEAKQLLDAASQVTMPWYNNGEKVGMLNYEFVDIYALGSYYIRITKFVEDIDFSYGQLNGISVDIPEILREALPNYRVEEIADFAFFLLIPKSVSSPTA